MDTNKDNLQSTEENAAESGQESAQSTPLASFSRIISDESLLTRLQGLGFITPTPVQEHAIPAALSGKDLIVQAKTGSGKTFAFSIPLLVHLHKAQAIEEIRSTYALVVTPTRELAQQVHDVIVSLSDRVRPTCVIGGVDMDPQIANCRENPQVVVGTPGRILDLMRQRVIRLNACRYFVLDEADEMLSMGFLEDVRSILSRLPDQRQGLFVGATITPRVEMLAHSFLSKPEFVMVDAPLSDLPSIEHLYCEVGGDLMAKPTVLCDLFETLLPESAIVFCNTKSDTKLLEALLRRRGFDARRINSDLTQNQRDRIMRQIRAKDLQFLVATDIAARGLDIEHIDLVINYTIHEQPEVYIHRTGRTGRAGRAGRAISLVGPRDFGAFHFLTKVIDARFKKTALPSEEEVADARLTHLYEIIRNVHVEPKERDLIAARKLLHEVGGLDEPADDLVAMTAKLCCHILEHALAQEAAALDEEDEAADEPPPRRDHERRDRGRDRSERGDDRRGNRGERRGRERNDDFNDRRGQGRDRERSHDRDRSQDRNWDRGRGREQDRGRDRGHGQDHDRRDGRAEGRERSRGREDSRPPRRDNSYERRDNDSYGNQNRRGRQGDRNRRDFRNDGPPLQVRLYIGQGLSHGMNRDVFLELAGELSEISESDVLRINFRDQYGFVDLLEPQAEILRRNLNGIEYNNAPLPVEFATALPANKPREQEEAPAEGDAEGG